MSTHGQYFRSCFTLLGCTMLLLSSMVSSIRGQNDEFFEAKIRPALHKHCLSCHHQGKKSGGLALDSRQGWEVGGDSGPAINLRSPEESLLIRTIKHTEAGLEMPAKAPKLSETTIADFIEWIRTGGIDPRDQPESIENLKVQSWDELYQERASWWSFQPLSIDRQDHSTTRQAIDGWIARKLQEQQIQPSEKADAYTLLRRLSFHLRGLPPSVEEIQKYIPELERETASTKAWDFAIP